MELVLIWLLLCVAVCVLAARYRRSVLGWLLLSIVLSPLVIVVLLALGARHVYSPSLVPSQPERTTVPSQDEVAAAWRAARLARLHYR